MKRKIVVMLSVILLITAIAGSYGLYSYASNTLIELDKQPVLSKYEVGTPDAEEMLELVNIERSKAGVAPLVMNENMHKTAQIKADDMFDRNYFAHNMLGTQFTHNKEMTELSAEVCTNSSENIYWGKKTNTSQGALNWWMNSESHKNAILNPKYSLTGFGIAGSKVVQHFCVAK